MLIFLHYSDTIKQKEKEGRNMNNLGQTFIYIWAVAMLAIFISGIIFIVNTIKKKDRKTIKKVFISSIIVAIACFVLYGITSPVTRCKHEYTTILDQAATCTEDGKREQHCPLCDFTKKETIKATGHKMEIKSKSEPTYDAEGEQIDVCSVCGYEVITKIDMLIKETTTEETTTEPTTTKATTTKPTTTKPTTTKKTNGSKNVSSYTYDEYVMYSTMLKGYAKVLNALKNPKTADFLGISYDPESEMVYFCVLADNSFGANTKCYIAYSKLYDKLDEGDDRKYYYESAEIKKTMKDLTAFMEAVENSNDEDIPQPTVNEKLSVYSSEEKEMFEILIEGIDDIKNLYDDVTFFNCKYNSKTENAYFSFLGKEIYSNRLETYYAWYNDTLGLRVGDQYKDDYENSDISYYEFEVNRYREAKKKDIS